jgi:antitoxin HigA-1
VSKPKRPAHPGRILKQEFMEPARISAYRLAKAAGLSQTLIGGILHGKRGITAETALRLERVLGVSAKTWLNLQSLYDLEMAQEETGEAIRQTTRKLDLRDSVATA